MGQQLFGTQHIIYLVISFAIIVMGWIICVKKLKPAGPEAQDKFFKIAASILVVMLIINRSFIHYYLARPFMPQSWCAVTGMIFALCLIFGKRDGYLIQYFAPTAVLSGFLPSFLGDYLNEGYTFGWDTILFPPTFTSLIYHSYMFFLAILIIWLHYWNFDIKKWYMFPVGYGLEILYGIIYLQFYPDGYTDAIGKTLNVMNVNKPALACFDAKLIFVLMMLAEAIIYPGYDYLKNKENSWIVGVVKKLKKSE